jgi:hypothetical protein
MNEHAAAVVLGTLVGHAPVPQPRDSPSNAVDVHKIVALIARYRALAHLMFMCWPLLESNVAVAMPAHLV